MLSIIDTHQHLWNLEQFSLPWLDSEGIESLRKNYLMSDYLEASRKSNVSKTIYMEVDVSPVERVAEAEFVIEMCRRDDNPMVGAVISGYPGYGEFRESITRFRDSTYIKGVRQVLQVPVVARGHCLEGGFVKDVQYLGELGKSFDICMRPSELVDAVGLVDQCPETIFILDHCGNADPQIVNGASERIPNYPITHEKEQWRRDVTALGKRDKVVCKISGIVARAPHGWTAETLAPTVDHCLNSFGPDRVVFGSDWPVCTLRASFAEWVAALREIVAGRPVEEQAKLFSENAERIYGLM